MTEPVVTSATTRGRIRPGELHKIPKESTLFVQNQTPHLWSFDNGKPGREGYLRLEPHGREGSISVVSREMVLDPKFQSAWRRSIVTIHDDETMDQTLSEQEQRAMAALDLREKESLEGVLTPSFESNDLESQVCLECGDSVMQSAEEIKELRPPLCSTHLHMEQLYTVTQLETPQGKQTKFTKVQIGDI